MRQAGPGGGTATSGKRGREMRQTWGGCSGGAGWGSKKREPAVQETPLPSKQQQQKWVLEGSRCLEQDSKGNCRAEAAGAVWNRRGLGPGARKR